MIMSGYKISGTRPHWVDDDKEKTHEGIGCSTCPQKITQRVEEAVVDAYLTLGPPDHARLILTKTVWRLAVRERLIGIDNISQSDDDIDNVIIDFCTQYQEILVAKAAKQHLEPAESEILTALNRKLG